MNKSQHGELQAKPSVANATGNSTAEMFAVSEVYAIPIIN
jgi:hypothetical protein